MRNLLKPLFRLFRACIAKTPFDVVRRLPLATLEPLRLVLEICQARGEEISILQIGACDGVTNDPIGEYLVRGSVRAILVEPNPFAFARLKTLYGTYPNVTLFQMAIAERDGETKFFRVKKSEMLDSGIDLSLQIASFYREHLHFHGLKNHQIEEITVPCRSLASLVAQARLSKIDILQIDAEGFDAAIVRMALKMEVQPSCINFEHLHLRVEDRQPLFNLLEANGYLLCSDASNIVALKQSWFQAMGKPVTTKVPVDSSMAES